MTYRLSRASLIGVHPRVCGVPNEQEFVPVVVVVLLDALKVLRRKEVYIALGGESGIDDWIGNAVDDSVDKREGDLHGGEKRRKKIGALVTGLDLTEAAESTGRITWWQRPAFCDPADRLVTTA